MAAFDPATRIVYGNMKDNLEKIDFDVIVDESYVPVVHPSMLVENAPPPIRTVDKFNQFDRCKSCLPITYIVDALVNHHYLEFVYRSDMILVQQWLEKYLKDFDGIDLSKQMEIKAFNNNARQALNMIKSNMREMEEWEDIKHPKQRSIEDILAFI